MKLFEVSEVEKLEYTEWVATRPPVVQAIATRLDPYTLYRLNTTNQLVTLVAISEDGTVRVRVWSGMLIESGMFKPHDVFGVNPDDLKPTPDGTPIPRRLLAEIEGLNGV